jgi:hypothetical protein
MFCLELLKTSKFPLAHIPLISIIPDHFASALTMFPFAILSFLSDGLQLSRQCLTLSNIDVHMAATMVPSSNNAHTLTASPFGPSSVI